jgi:hypothetical protein
MKKAAEPWSVGGVSLGPNDYAAFFDASGHPDDKNPHPVLFVSGFVASSARCRRFETEWPVLLDRYGIKPPFHRVKLEAGKGQYARFKKDPDLHRAFLSEAISVIRRGSNTPLSMGVRIEDLARIYAERIIPDDWPREPYPWCAGRVMVLLQTWAQRRVKRGKAHGANKLVVMFEKGDKDAGRFVKASKHLFSFEPLFLSKSDCLQFQACDLFAWDQRRYLTDRANGRPVHLRPSMIQAYQQLPFAGCMYSDYSGLVRDCDKYRYPLRS